MVSGVNGLRRIVWEEDAVVTVSIVLSFSARRLTEVVICFSFVEVLSYSSLSLELPRTAAGL